MDEPALRENILSYLREHQQDLKDRFSLVRIAVIGSVARGDYTDESDVDIIVTFQPETDKIYNRKQELRSELEVVFHRPVQIASEKYLIPYYRSEILREAVYV